MTKQTAHLEDWLYIPGWQTLSGVVTGHPLLEDGLQILTSRVLSLDIVKMTAETRNTNYTLGAPVMSNVVPPDEA